MKFREDYQRYKDGPIAEQWLRVCNTMFLVFTFWNIIRFFLILKAADLSQAALVASSVAVVCLGIVLALLILLKSTWKEHVVVLPIAALAFTFLNDRDTTFRLILIPLISIAVLLLVRLITSLSNKINRL